MKRLLLTAIGFACVPFAALAADLAPQPVEPMAPVVPAAYSWTGFYGGIQAGYSWGKSDYSDYLRSTGQKDYSGTLDPDGFTGGIYAGANFQFQNNLVVGIEADGNFDSVKDTSRARGNPDFPGGVFPVTPTTQEAKLKWDASVRARIGYAIDRFLPYLTGGVAFGKYDFNPTWPVDGAISYSSTRTGWTLGAGLEYAITDNLIARAEYRYSDYGSKTYVEPVTPAFSDKIDLKTNTIRAGIAYKF